MARKPYHYFNPRGLCKAIAQHYGYRTVSYVSDILRRRQRADTESEQVLEIKLLAARIRALMRKRADLKVSDALYIVTGGKAVQRKRRAARAAGPKGGGQ